MRVRRGDRAVQRLRRGLSVEGGVSGAAQQAGREGEQGGVGRDHGVQRGHHVAVRHALGPVDAERQGAATQRRDGLGVRRRQRPQQPDPAAEHQACGGDAGQQADLGVPALAGQLRPQLERGSAVRVEDDLLLRGRQVDGVALPGEGLAVGADHPEQLEHRPGGPVVKSALDGGVVQPRPGPHQGPAHVDRRELTPGVQVQPPQQGRAHLVGEQAGRALAEHRRMQRDPFVRGVQRDPAPGQLGVERPSGRHEGSDVGDGVPDGEPLTGRLEVQCLVQVPAAGRIDRQHRQVGPVQLRQPGRRRGSRRLGERLGRERARDLQLSAQAVQVEQADRG